MKMHAWRKLILWNAFWMCLSLFLMGLLFANVSDDDPDNKFPFDIRLDSK